MRTKFMTRRDLLLTGMTASATGLAAPALAQGFVEVTSATPTNFDPAPQKPAVSAPRPQPDAVAPATPAEPVPGTHLAHNGEVVGDLRYAIPADHKPRRVQLSSDVPAGEIHVAPSSFALYFGLGGGEAIRYRVGIGRENLYRAGEFRVGRKVRWPSWTPTRNMIRREPEKYAQYAGGMKGGPENPLGSRALYLHYYGGGDTFLRIHGTPQPWTITKATSSGCVRMINAHVVDLFNRVPVGARVKLYEKMVDYDPTV